MIKKFDAEYEGMKAKTFPKTVKISKTRIKMGEVVFKIKKNNKKHIFCETEMDVEKVGALVKRLRRLSKTTKINLSENELCFIIKHFFNLALKRDDGTNKSLFASFSIRPFIKTPLIVIILQKKMKNQRFGKMSFDLEEIYDKIQKLIFKYDYIHFQNKKGIISNTDISVYELLQKVITYAKGIGIEITNREFLETKKYHIFDLKEKTTTEFFLREE